MTRRSLTGSVALVLVLGAAAASVTLASNAERDVPSGPRPDPPEVALCRSSKSRFANPRWGGSIVLALTPDGREVMNVGGIAPGVCEDEDFGHLVAGRDGATGPTFGIYLPARISANGSFARSESHKGQRIPFKPAASATVKGTFSGDTVRGTLRASYTTRFDSCRANASFTARRIQ